MQLQAPSSLFPPLLTKLAVSIFLVFVTWLSVVAGSRYAGNPLVFASFAVLGNALLLAGFRRGASFFDSFIGIFFWLGFFLKLAVRVAFFDGQFSEATGAFDGSGPGFDTALSVCSVAFAALIIGSVIRQRLVPYPDRQADCANSGLYRFYCRHRNALLVGFVALVLLVTISNAWLGIYQRGLIARTVLPFGLNGIYKWLLQFGLASISALIIRFEIVRANGLTNAGILLPLLENCLSNVSLLSRGMILNGAALALGTWRQLVADRMKLRSLSVLIAAIGFCALLAASVFAVNFLRADARFEPANKNVDRASMLTGHATYMSKALFVDRWVGMEGVLAVSSSRDLGWEVWRQAWREKFDEHSLSFYDSHFISSPYKDVKPDERFHFVSLPGLIAFLYYTGSLWFVFAATLVVSFGAALLEIGCYRWCGHNLVLCSLFAQVLAFRFASFGYAPAQSHLLIGSLILNGALIALADFLLSRQTDRRTVMP